MFGIGGFELILILLFGFLIFGPEKLPEIAKTIGKGIAKFRMAQEDITEQLKGSGFVDMTSEEPFKNPLTVIEEAQAAAKEKGDTVKQSVKEAANAAGEAASAAQEGFAQRKARYDAERRARKEAEAKAREASGSDPSQASEGAELDPVEDVSAKKIVEESD